MYSLSRSEFRLRELSVTTFDCSQDWSLRFTNFFVGYQGVYQRRPAPRPSAREKAKLMGKTSADSMEGYVIVSLRVLSVHRA